MSSSPLVTEAVCVSTRFVWTSMAVMFSTTKLVIDLKTSATAFARRAMKVGVEEARTSAVDEATAEMKVVLAASDGTVVSRIVTRASSATVVEAKATVVEARAAVVEAVASSDDEAASRADCMVARLEATDCEVASMAEAKLDTDWLVEARLVTRD